VGGPREIGHELSVVAEIGAQHFRYGEDDLVMDNEFREIAGEPSRPFFRPTCLATRAESACLAAEMKQFLRTAARALDTGETVHGVPAVEEPVYNTFGHTA
jgi:hypothetical protein